MAVIVWRYNDGNVLGLTREFVQMNRLRHVLEISRLKSSVDSFPKICVRMGTQTTSLKTKMGIWQYLWSSIFTSLASLYQMFATKIHTFPKQSIGNG
jgi:hypothetical protein